MHITRFEVHALKTANLSKTLCVGAKFPTFAIEAVAKAVGRQSGPSAAVRANRTGVKGVSSLQ